MISNIKKFIVFLFFVSFKVYATCDDQPANEVDWTNCNFIEQLDLSGVALANAQMAGVNLALVNFEKSQINNANMSYGNFILGNFNNSNLFSSNMQYANCNNTNFDNANLEDLSVECQKRNQWEFMFSAGPLRLKNTTGSPVNPIAVF